MYREGVITRFQLGRVRATKAALTSLHVIKESLTEFLVRHQTGHFGDVTDVEGPMIEWLTDRGKPVLSVFRIDSGQILMIATEADRSTTNVRLLREWLTGQEDYLDA